MAANSSSATRPPRPRIAEELGFTPRELAKLHRRFEVVPGAQAQVDWGDEGGILAHVGIPKVYSFHMVLSYSRDPFCCFTTSQNLASFFECHRRAFAHFGGAPGVIVYDRTKTVVRRHVAPGEAVPLHPEAVAFAGHYDFDIDVLAAYRPTGKGRVERQSLSSVIMCCPGGPSPAWTIWTGRSWPGCPSAGRGCTAPTVR